MINRTTSISIVGGGIGGLVAAIALRKKGFAPIVYEKVPQIRPLVLGLFYRQMP